MKATVITTGPLAPEWRPYTWPLTSSRLSTCFTDEARSRRREVSTARGKTLVDVEGLLPRLTKSTD
jgi:hypothetical protein